MLQRTCSGVPVGCFPLLKPILSLQSMLFAAPKPCFVAPKYTFGYCKIPSKTDLLLLRKLLQNDSGQLHHWCVFVRVRERGREPGLTPSCQAAHSITVVIAIKEHAQRQLSAREPHYSVDMYTQKIWGPKNGFERCRIRAVGGL